MSLRPRLVPLVATLAALLAPGAATAAPADLDLTYGAGGIVSRDVVPGVNADLITPQAVARLDDGTSIVAGSTADQRVFIVRLTATGAIHPGWGGYRYVDVDQGSEQVAFVDERGGTVVVGGGLDNAGFLIQVRLDTGAPDTNFGNDDGIVLHQVKTGSVPFTDGAIDTDRGIYVTVGGTATRVRRYLASGRADGAFGSEGEVATPWITSNPRLALDPARKIVIVGLPSAGYGYEVARLLGKTSANPGGLDSTFGPILSGTPSAASAIDVATDAAGRIYLLGRRADGYEISRYPDDNADLGLSTGFGLSGFAFSAATIEDGDVPVAIGVVGPASAPRAIVVGTTGANTQPWAEAVNVTGTVDAGFNGSVALSMGCADGGTCGATALGISRLGDAMTVVGTRGAGLRGHAAVVTASGSLDATFGTGGRLAFAPTRPWSSDVIDAVVGPDGSLTALGESGPPTDGFTWITRQLPNGQPDPAFGTDGRVSANLSGGGPDYLNALTVVPDGTIYTTRGSSGPGFSLQRWTSAGRDASYGSAGDLEVTIGGTGNRATAITADSQGRIIVAGEGRLAGDKRSWMVRLDPATGALDPTWNGGAITFTNAGAALDEGITALRRLADGSFAAAGHVGSEAAVLRVRADGTPDAGFGTGGLQRLPQLGPYDPSMPVDVDGAADALLVAATTIAGAGREIAVARVDDVGRLDGTFGVSGVARIAGPSASEVRATDVAVDASGRTVLSGMQGSGAAADALVARLTPSGSLDPAFGAGGLRRLDLSGGGAEDRLVRVAVAGGQAIVAVGQGIDAASGTARLLAARFIGGPSTPPTPGPPTPPTSQPQVERPTAPPLAATATTFTTTISALKRQKARQRLVIRGTAKATPNAVQSVEVSVRQISSGRCRYLRSVSTTRLSNGKPVQRACTAPIWLRARGAATWTLTLKRGLPAGRYELRARALPTAGQPQSAFVSGRNKIVVRVK